MSKFNTVRSDLTLDDVDDLVNSCDLDDDDYIIVVGRDGELKSVFVPESGIGETPEKMQQILALYGIHDVDYVTGNQTMH